MSARLADMVIDRIVRAQTTPTVEINTAQYTDRYETNDDRDRPEETDGDIE